MKFSEQLKSGVILDNPIFMQTIGLCPTLATTTSLPTRSAWALRLPSF